MRLLDAWTRFMDWMTDVDHDLRGSVVFVVAMFALSFLVVVLLEGVLG